MPDARRWRASVLWILALITLVGAVYGRTVGFGYVEFDDPLYASDNQHVRAGLSLAGARWAWTDVSTGNWHPITWLSLMADGSLGGGAATHHAVNVLLHALNTVLVFVLLAAATGRFEEAGWVAALFAVHPVHVESVAWISERKDLLCAAFGLAALGCYGLALLRGSTKWYVLALCSYAASLLSKPMLVTMPALLLVCAAWPLDRPRTGSGKGTVGPVAELVPFAVLAAVAAVMALMSQRAGRAMAGLDVLPLGSRLTNALVTYAIGLARCVWPVGLGPLYGFPTEGYPWPAVASAAAIVALLITAAVGPRRRGSWLAAGSAWFLLVPIPVLGLVQIGVQSRADRYMYLALLGPIEIAVGCAALVGRRGGIPRWALRTCGAVALLALGAVAFRQVGYWRDGVSLFRRAVALEPANARAQRALGVALHARGDPAALPTLARAAELAPYDSVVRTDYGRALVEAKRQAEGLAELEAALGLAPGDVRLRVDVGRLRVVAGDLESGLKLLLEATRQSPEDPYGWKWLAAGLAVANRRDEALAALTRARSLDPSDPDIDRWERRFREVGDRNHDGSAW